VVFELQLADLVTNAASSLRVLAAVREMGFAVCIAGLGAGFGAFDLVNRVQPDYLALDPSISAGAASDPTLIDVVQLLLRFSARAEARLIATEVTSEPQLKALRKVGVELVAGEIIARADTRLPKVPAQRLKG